MGEDGDEYEEGAKVIIAHSWVIRKETEIDTREKKGLGILFEIWLLQNTWVGGNIVLAVRERVCTKINRERSEIGWSRVLAWCERRRVGLSREQKSKGEKEGEGKGLSIKRCEED